MKKIICTLLLICMTLLLNLKADDPKAENLGGKVEIPNGNFEKTECPESEDEADEGEGDEEGTGEGEEDGDAGEGESEDEEDGGGSKQKKQCEEKDKIPAEWIINPELNGHVVKGMRTGGNGNFYLQFTAVPGQDKSITLAEKIAVTKPIQYKGYKDSEKKYQISFWAKASNADTKMKLQHKSYYPGTNYTTNPITNEYDFDLTTDWKKYTLEVTLPEGYTQGNFEIYVLEGSGTISLDDFECYEEQAASTPKLTKLNGLKSGTIYQREVEISWEKGEDGANYEIVMDNKVVGTTSNTSYYLTNLDADKEYKVAVHQKKGEQVSKDVEISFKTKGFEQSVPEKRIPHLLTVEKASDKGLTKDLRLQGTILDLHFNDITGANAKFTYFVDGVEKTVTDYKIDFQTEGTHKLKIKIEEASGQKWELDYTIAVKNLQN